jgi:hypothetical protein
VALSSAAGWAGDNSAAAYYNCCSQLHFHDFLDKIEVGTREIYAS